MRESRKTIREICLATTSSVVAVLLLCAAFSGSALSQAETAEAQWLEYRDTSYIGEPILVHLPTNYQRVIVMPENVELKVRSINLPNCDIAVNGNVVSFYPTDPFGRRPMILIGRETGTQYELSIRASAKGLRQPIRVNR